MHYPEAFQGFAATSPSIWWNVFELLKQVKEAKLPASPSVFYDSGGKETMIAEDVQKMYQELKPFLKNIDFYTGMDENHASIVSHVISRAFRFLLLE